MTNGSIGLCRPFGAHAMGARESCQGREAAALSGYFYVPWGTPRGRHNRVLREQTKQRAFAAFLFAVGSAG